MHNVFMRVYTPLRNRMRAKWLIIIRSSLPVRSPLCVIFDVVSSRKQRYEKPRGFPCSRSEFLPNFGVRDENISPSPERERERESHPDSRDNPPPPFTLSGRFRFSPRRGMVAENKVSLVSRNLRVK